jgi:hypothetical protein
VLRNPLGIKSVREIERKESEALLAATEQMIDETRIDQCFTPDYVRRMNAGRRIDGLPSSPAFAA